MSSHGGWKAASDRPDPIVLLEQQDETREPDLVPVRHGRMMVSPFTFYRGAAKIMAADLKDTPRAGLTVQLCGDAHLSNFGAFASPERRLVFDLNDFDETLPGPFEYDVKRMAASFLIAAQNNGFAKADAKAVTMASVAAYRKAMAEFAQMRTLDIWYAHMDEEQIMAAAEGEGQQAEGRSRRSNAAKKNIAKAHTRDSLQALSKLAVRVDGQYRIASQPPIVIPLRDLAATHGVSPDEVEATIQEEFHAYRATLPDDRRDLLERFHIVDVARKVVGVGSVGTRAFIALLQGRDEQDPLFLQVKEATASVLEDHLPRSRYQSTRRARGQGPAHDAGRKRHLPRLDAGPGDKPVLLLAPAARHEGLRARGGACRRPRSASTGALRLDAGPSTRPFRVTRSASASTSATATRSTER